MRHHRLRFALRARGSAHLAYRGEHTNSVTNGLLLRADIHTLFDLGVLAVNPETEPPTVAISESLH